MVIKHTKGLALVGGHATGTAPGVFAGSAPPRTGIVVRLLRALGWSSRPAPAPRVLPRVVEQEGTGLLHEKYFASEHEAQDYAREMTARGYRAQAQYDVYDYSWSVQVHAAATGEQ